MGKRDMEFRAEDDDAWYTVKVQLQGDTLLIDFRGIRETAQIAASMFHSPEAVERFVRRFRVVSPQLQDSECRRISKGSIVCAACHAFPGDDMRYYDAIVEAVDRKAHSCVNEEEEEECRCTFVLSWLHGPNTGLLTSASIASVCTVNDESQIDPKVTYFSRLAKSKVAVSSRKSTSIYRKEASAGLVLAKGGRKLLTDQKNFSFQDIHSQWKLIDGSESKGFFRIQSRI